MSEIRMAVIEEQMDELVVRVSAVRRELDALVERVFADAAKDRAKFDASVRSERSDNWHHAAFAHRVDRDRRTRKYQEAMKATVESTAQSERVERLSERLSELERAVTARRA